MALHLRTPPSSIHFRAIEELSRYGPNAA